MAARSHAGVQSAAQEARRILGMTEAAALWEGEIGKGPLLGRFPWQGSAGRRAVSDRGAAAAPDGLSALADSIGSERGARRLRTAEIYGMLFQGLRDRAPGVVEITRGMDGKSVLPDHGRLWAEFFSGAQVTVLCPDEAPAGWPAGGPVWARAEAESRKGFARALDAALAGQPAPMIVVDDGSHASHHQQNAFLELFPRLAPGGFYIVEGLRGQPEALERAGITRSADLFRGFAEKRCFAHSDVGTEAAFAALGPQISGVLMLQAGFDRNRRDIAAVIHKR
jgi:hypothetical protein